MSWPCGWTRSARRHARRAGRRGPSAHRGRSRGRTTRAGARPAWFHTVALNREHGLYTPGVACDHRSRVPFLPLSFAGERVLDVGTFDGFYALLAEHRGAALVVAVDNEQYVAWVRARWGIELQGGEGFATIADLLGSRVQYRRGDALALDGPAERFDVVLCFGILHRVENPLGLLRRLAALLAPGVACWSRPTGSRATAASTRTRSRSSGRAASTPATSTSTEASARADWPRSPSSSNPDCVPEDVSGPSSCDRARLPGWTSRWGRVARTFRTTKRRSTAAAGLVLASPAVAVVATRPDGALACRPEREPFRGAARAPASGAEATVRGVSFDAPSPCFIGRVLRDSGALTTAERLRDAGQCPLRVPLAERRSPCSSHDR